MIGKRRTLVLAILGVLVLGSGAAISRQRASHDSPSTHDPNDRIDDPVVCPVCAHDRPGRAVVARSDATEVDHRGRRLYFCGLDCLSRFRKDPGLFLASLAEWLEGSPGLEPEAVVPEPGAPTDSEPGAASKAAPATEGT